MSKKQFNPAVIELAKDIAAFASITAKVGFEDCLTNQKLFVEMCNEAGFTTVSGKPLTQMNFRHMMGRLPDEVKLEIRDSFDFNA